MQKTVMKKISRYKIAVVIPKYGLVGGAEGFAAELTERLALNDRYEFHVFANAWQAASGHILFHRVPIIRFPKFMVTPSFAIFAEKRLSRIPFDLIHTHDRIYRADLYTLHGIPHRVWCLDVRKKRFLTLFDRATVAVERRLVTGGRCRRFLAVSRLTRDIFLKEYPMAADKVPVIHPGITATSHTEDEKKDWRREMRKRFGVAPAEALILFVSMNFDIKGLDAVMAGMGQLQTRDGTPAWKLLVVGKGNEKHYRGLAERLGIAARVIFSGIVTPETLEEIYLAADLYAMLSKFDTFGLVVLEAMAAGLPVLISGTVGARDIVREGENGFVIEDTGNTKNIADKLRLMLDEDVRFRMAQEARRTAGQYSWEDTASKVETLYRGLLDESVHHHRLL